MAQKNKPEPAKTETPATEATDGAAATSNEAKVAEPRSYPKGEELAGIIARKQAHGVLGKPWKMKGGTTEIPQRFDKAEVAQYEAKLGGTPEETMRNMMAFCDGTDEEKAQAVLDKFNQADRLEAQKLGKLAMSDAATDVALVQEIVHGHLSGSKRRGAGGPKAGAAKVRAEKAEAKAQAAAQSAQEILAELRAINPEAAAKYEARLAQLGQ